MGVIRNDKLMSMASEDHSDDPRGDLNIAHALPFSSFGCSITTASISHA
jgi:hypothetical protein